jgi:hypothetical protein
MKNKLLIMSILLATGLVFQSCSEDLVNAPETPSFYTQKGAVATISDVVNGFYDLGDTDNTAVGFTINTAGESPTAVNVYKSFNGGERAPHSVVTPPFPVVLLISLNDALNGLGVEVGDLQVGDVITYSFEVVTSTGTYKTGGTLSAVMSCSSSLAGTYDLVTTEPWCDGSLTSTSTSTWFEVSAGVYGIEDFAFGTYELCYGPGASFPEGTLAVNDVCNEIEITGLSQWDEEYTWDILDSGGDELVIKWSNDYGEAGVATLTRTDGSPWPPLKMK